MYFALKFDIRVVGTYMSHRITKYEGNIIFQRKPSLNIENF